MRIGSFHAFFSVSLWTGSTTLNRGVVAGSSGIFEGSITRTAEEVKGKTHDPQTDVYRYGGSHRP